MQEVGFKGGKSEINDELPFYSVVRRTRQTVRLFPIICGNKEVCLWYHHIAGPSQVMRHTFLTPGALQILETPLPNSFDNRICLNISYGFPLVVLFK